MIGTSLKTTLVHGGAEAPRDTREARREERVDGFAESISSALERLVAPAARTEPKRSGMDASLEPALDAQDDDGAELSADGEAASSLVDASAGVLGVPTASGATPTWTPGVGAMDAHESQPFTATRGGLEAWGGPAFTRPLLSDAPPAAGLLEAAEPGPEEAHPPSIATRILRDLDAEQTAELTLRRQGEASRTTRTLPDGLAGEPPASKIALPSAGALEDGSAAVRIRPPSAREAQEPALRPPGAEPRGADTLVRGDARGAASERGDAPEEHRGHGGDRASLGRREREEAERASGSDKTRREADRAPDRVQTAPLLTVGDAPSVAWSSTGTHAGSLGLPPPVATSETAATLGAAPDSEPTAYQVVRLDDRTARVELSHPELGRIEVEVRTESGRVDVDLLARSVSASVALRASEPELREELRQRGGTLRSYRVRTATSPAQTSEEKSR
jgi:hypothetical protein